MKNVLELGCFYQIIRVRNTNRFKQKKKYECNNGCRFVPNMVLKIPIEKYGIPAILNSDQSQALCDSCYGNPYSLIETPISEAVTQATVLLCL
jgi:hypothetical protein